MSFGNGGNSRYTYGLVFSEDAADADAEDEDGGGGKGC